MCHGNVGGSGGGALPSNQAPSALISISFHLETALAAPAIA